MNLRIAHLLSSLLRPAVRFCLRYGLHVQDVLEVAKAVFLEESQLELRKKGDEPNVSRLSAATGIHRRDVIRISKRQERKNEPQGLVSRIIGQWQFDAEFQDEKKHPRRLSFEGEENEFQLLVRKVSHDLHPSTVRLELERLGAVEKSADYLVLRKNAYVPTGDVLSAYELLGEDVSSLGQAVEENVQALGELRNLHARTEFDNISLSELPAIREWILREGSKFHTRVRDHLAKFDLDYAPSGAKGVRATREGGGKVLVGSFSVSTVSS